MQLLTLGLNHTTAPLAVRERVVFLADEVGATIGRLRDRLSAPAGGRVSEAAIVSTCNRTEVYCAAEEPDIAQDALRQFVAAERQLDLDELQRHSYVLPHVNAVRHAFRVASGLDSMVLGEPQILGQMKEAEKLARNAGGLGLMLNHLFQRTFAVAKEVRSTTEIGTQSVSMAAAAVRVARKIFGELDHSHVLFVGAGEMIDLTATHFAAQRPKSITVANRTLDRAEALAARLHGQPMKLGDLPDALAKFDIVVSCTASLLPIIGLGMVERAIRTRRHKPMFMVDLAVPRDVEPEVARLDDVYRAHRRRSRQGGRQRQRHAPSRRRTGRGDHRIARSGFRAMDPGAPRGADDPGLAWPRRRLAHARAAARPEAARQGRAARACARAAIARADEQVSARTR